MNILLAALFAATLTIDTVDMPTYPYDDPDPVPAPERSFWPYVRHDGMSRTAVTQTWKRVTLESDRLRITILPQVGGKIWGAVDKKTGVDFIYQNDAVKFRDIAMCGPWTSGGIEFNFGIIGHHPMTAAEVDWTTRTNADGSVSYFCGHHEKVCDTTWQVEVRLRDGEDFFMTRTQWYNSSPYEEPYYQWMNGAFPARADSEFRYPGQFYIGHAGDVEDWPCDKDGHNLSIYRENAFGHDKSYHLVGGDERFLSVWWPSLQLGAYHEAAYGEKYGRKIFMWALSREGGIWEDLLTDHHGQYVELQSGRVFSQPRVCSMLTPFKHPAFTPARTDIFEERWGVVRSEAEIKAHESPALQVAREREMPSDFDWETAYGHYIKADQYLRACRALDESEKELSQALRKEPYFVPALELQAEIAARRGQYEVVRASAAKALSVDMYAPKANYLDGLACAALGEPVTALSRLGFAAFDVTYRAAANEAMARIEQSRGNLDAADFYLRKALLANPLSLSAQRFARDLARARGDAEEFARRERDLARDWPALREEGAAPASVKSPFERAIELIHLGQDKEADEILESCGDVEDAIFRQFRARRRTGEKQLADLLAAQRLGDSWRIGRDLGDFYLEEGRFCEAEQTLKDYLTRYPGKNPLEILYADTLQRMGRNQECVDFMKGIYILPAEGTQHVVRIWQRAWKCLGNDEMARSYPENLGTGKPFEE